jgi:hypothetical protein
MAGWTGLEPAASGVTGRRSNQLNYHPDLWSLARQPKRALVTARRLVGGTGLEPVTPGV